MHRIDGPGNLGNMFSEGDPDSGVPATVVTDDFMNAVQEEIVAVIVGAGLSLSKPNNAQLKQAISLLVKPVGTVEIRHDDVSPATLYGGAWTEFGQGRMLVGKLTSDADFDTVGETGGEKEHTLTIAEMPAHTHSGFAGRAVTNGDTSGNGGDNPYTGTTGSQGGGNPHNNMPPYLVVRFWRRTA